MSRVLEFTSYGGSSNTSLLFSVPLFNNTKIISPEILSNELRPIYYGDEVNLRFWASLHLNIGSNSSLPIRHLQEGYKYVYDSYSTTFYIIDNTGNIVETIHNIKSVGDMRIDFNIYKSHQLEIIITGMEETYPFYIPAKLNWNELVFDEYKDVPDGILNIYDTDTERPYEQFNSNNPKRLIHYIDDFVPHNREQFNYANNYTLNINANTYNVFLLGDTKIHWNKMYYANELVCNKYRIFDSDIFKCKYNTDNPDNPPIRNIIFTGTLLDISWLLSCYTLSLYPELMPIILNNETINNRPVYEPWMIWGLYKFIWNKKNTDTTDDFVIPIFDLSPNWG